MTADRDGALGEGTRLVRSAKLDVFDREAERQQAGVPDLEAILEGRDANRSAALRVIGVSDGVDDCLADSDGRQVSPLLPANRPDRGIVHRMLLDEADGRLDRARRVRSELGPIEHAALVATGETSGLDPWIREVPFAVDTEEQDAADGGRSATLVLGQHAEWSCPDFVEWFGLMKRKIASRASA